MHAVRAPLAVLAAGLWLGAGGAVSRAQECATPDLEHAVPADGASRVPTDAVLRARYPASAEYRGEVVVLQREGAPEVGVDAEWQPAERALAATPPSPLEPGASYTVRWPALRSVDGESLGSGAILSFTAGEGPDREPPELEGVERLEWDALKSHDDCVGSAEERYLFDFTLAGVSDDTGPGTLQALIYQSAGPEISEDDPPVLVAVEPMATAGEVLRVRLPREQSLGEVCFVVIARDLAGNLSSGSEETCIETKRPPFFGGCAVQGLPSPTPPTMLLAFVLPLTLTLRRRAPRCDPASSARRSS